MKIKSIQLSNFQSFRDCALEGFTGINLIVGPNNAGKSAIIRAFMLLQEFEPDQKNTRSQCVRSGADLAKIRFSLEGPVSRFLDLCRGGYCPGAAAMINPVLELSISEYNARVALYTQNGDSISVGEVDYHWAFRGVHPDNLFFTALANRRVSDYEVQVTHDLSNRTSLDHKNLAAKIAWFNSEPQQVSMELSNALFDILGLELKTVAAMYGSGLVPAYPLGRSKSISIQNMGAGVPQVASLLCDLLRADGHIFLIEELENDLHPTALLKLAEVIKSVADRGNQFFITTHSNVVLSALGAYQDARIIKLNCSYRDVIPTTTATVLPNRPEARWDLLVELGYSASDFGFWDGFIITEESSAEELMCKFLIPWFAPSLSGRIRLVSSAGVDNVRNRIRGLYNHLLYLKLTPAVNDRIWVMLDGDEAGLNVASDLKAKFTKLPKDNIYNLKNEMFEKYFPEYFFEDVKALDTAPDTKFSKTALLKKVVARAESEPDIARVEFARSFSEIITWLKSIEATLKRF